LGSAAIPELQKIFDAKGRAEAYNQAAEMIHDGVLEYYEHNPQPSSVEFTPNGLTLVKKIAAAINLVNDTITGHLPSQTVMKQAVEEMTPGGTKPQNPSETPANKRVQAASNTKVQIIQTVQREEFEALKRQVETERIKKPANVDFVTAIRQLNRDPSIADKKALYVTILAEANLTGVVQPEPNAMIEFFETTDDEGHKQLLKDAVNKHLNH
jgi:hypothetical protein